MSFVKITQSIIWAKKQTVFGLNLIMKNKKVNKIELWLNQNKTFYSFTFVKQYNTKISIASFNLLTTMSFPKNPFELEQRNL